jgi:phosphatidylserine/phosphatidylglycerophosphate/cardiolipin synthase-like enzyme
LKVIAVDGALLYLGSANFTGAGLGAKGDGRRNFEAGIVTDDEWLLDEMQGTFDAIWTGKHCSACQLRAECPKPLDARVESKGRRTQSRKPSSRG